MTTDSVKTATPQTTPQAEPAMNAYLAIVTVACLSYWLLAGLQDLVFYLGS